jgi:hypothetical protein
MLPGTGGEEILGCGPIGGDDTCSRIAVLAAMFAVAPLGAKGGRPHGGAGEGFNPEEDAAVREIIAAFVRETGKPVDLEQPSQSETEAKALAAVV